MQCVFVWDRASGVSIQTNHHYSADTPDKVQDGFIFSPGFIFSGDRWTAQIACHLWAIGKWVCLVRSPDSISLLPFSIKPYVCLSLIARRCWPERHPLQFWNLHGGAPQSLETAVRYHIFPFSNFKTGTHERSFNVLWVSFMCIWKCSRYVLFPRSHHFQSVCALTIAAFHCIYETQL